MKWTIHIKKPSHVNFNQMQVMNFWMVRIRPYFHKSIEGAIWIVFQIFSSQDNVSTKSIWGATNKDSKSWNHESSNKTWYWFGLIRNFKRKKKEVKVGMMEW
jgi:hypothetical protein